MPNKFLFTGLKICEENGILKSHSILIENGKIKRIFRANEKLKDKNIEILHFPPSCHLIPGFIDMHIHGTKGADIMDGSPNALSVICSSLPEEGTTSFLATTLTSGAKDIQGALKNIKNFKSKSNNKGRAEILGVHLEGPFISKHRAGAQPSKYIIPPDVKLFQKWFINSGGMIKVVTAAPETVGFSDFIEKFIKKDIVFSIGHTEGAYEEIVRGIELGCTHAAHLFNAMSGFDHKNPGAVTAILLSDKVNAEIICDGIHVHPNIVQCAYKIKGADKIILVTDSIRAKMMKDGIYDLGGQKVNVSNGVARLKNGKLAGSTLKMIDAFKNMMEFTDCGILNAVKMSSVNPAKELGVFGRKGSIKEGKDADLVVLDGNNDVILTLCGSKIAYKK